MRIIAIIAVFALLSSCSTSKTGNNNSNTLNFQPNFAPGPPTIVYKTIEDVNDLVPVLLNEEKTRIISYPSKNDIKTGVNYKTPTVLKQGWLLDEKGINQNVAFLSLNYIEYSKLDSLPSIDSMFKLIVNFNPIDKMCNCGNRISIPNPIEQLNELIESDRIEKVCKVIK